MLVSSMQFLSTKTSLSKPLQCDMFHINIIHLFLERHYELLLSLFNLFIHFAMRSSQCSIRTQLTLTSDHDQPYSNSTDRIDKIFIAKV
jgi:hypothetical protein